MKKIHTVKSRLSRSEALCGVSLTSSSVFMKRQELKIMDAAKMPRRVHRMKSWRIRVKVVATASG